MGRDTIAMHRQKTKLFVKKGERTSKIEHLEKIQEVTGNYQIGDGDEEYDDEESSLGEKDDPYGDEEDEDEEEGELYMTL